MKSPLKGTPCPACGRWPVTAYNRCYGCRKPFLQCTCGRKR